ncbi:hypothetical protein AMJ52_06005 [candidate division TA06 bacterium DG_78]|uniref:DUF5723 domain-containing protein n=1 Tax=candidate division TA06 bacterium DG_78 TaxID=1703772 RepID=A0A0S7YEL5_UNCT6|nr:MAG: hypothetical protein AMJ52_06005 [candidate division TA06 bacterium DG_78]
MALGYAVTASNHGVNAIRSNPAALTLLSKNELMCGYEHSLSGIEGLHNITIAFCRPMFGGGLGIQVSEFGFSEQKEQAVTCAFGLHLSDEFKLGVGSDLYLINNKRTGKNFAYGLNVAFLATLYERWSLGVFGHNLNQPQFGSTEEGQLPQEFSAGFAYQPFDDILSEIDFSLIEDNLRIHVAGELKLLNRIFFRTGVQTNPSVISAGTGVVYKFITIDYAVEYIPELPLTHAINMNFEF